MTSPSALILDRSPSIAPLAYRPAYWALSFVLKAKFANFARGMSRPHRNELKLLQVRTQEWFERYYRIKLERTAFLDFSDTESHARLDGSLARLVADAILSVEASIAAFDRTGLARTLRGWDFPIDDIARAMRDDMDRFYIDPPAPQQISPTARS